MLQQVGPTFGPSRILLTLIGRLDRKQADPVLDLILIVIVSASVVPKATGFLPSPFVFALVCR